MSQMKLEKATEHGSNSNGEYWKFQNGLLICKHDKRVNISVSGSGILGGYRFDWTDPWIFPHSFINKPFVSINNSSGAGNNFIVLMHNALFDKIDYMLTIHISSGPTVVDVGFYAIGRWK